MKIFFDADKTERFFADKTERFFGGDKTGRFYMQMQ